MKNDFIPSIKDEDSEFLKKREEPVEIKKEEIPAERPKPELHMVMSTDDSYISDRISSQPKSLEEVIFLKEPICAPTEHRLSLPKELRVYGDRLAFRWVNKKKRAIDDAIDVRGWYFVNRITFPEVPNRIFSTSGAIERGDTILMYMPLKKAEILRNAPGEKSAALLKAQLAKGEGQLPKGQSGFYKPTEGVSEDDSVDTDALVEGKHF